MTPEQRQVLDEAIRSTNDYSTKRELIRYRDTGQVPTNPSALKILVRTAQRMDQPSPTSAPPVGPPAPQGAAPPAPPAAPYSFGGGASAGTQAAGGIPPTGGAGGVPLPPPTLAGNPLLGGAGASGAMPVTSGPGGGGMDWSAPSPGAQAGARAGNFFANQTVGEAPVTPPDPTTAIGAPPATPTPATGQGSVAFGQNSIFRDNPDDMLLALLDRIGVDLGSPGLYGKQIASSINDYLPYFHQLLGLQGGAGGGASGNVDSMYTGGLDQLAGMVGNNTLFSGMQDFANQTKGTLGARLGDIKDVQQQKSYLDAMLALSTAGQNPLLRQGAADNAMRSWLGYKRGAIADPMGVGTKGSYVSFLEDQTDPAYSTVLQLLGGGGR